MVPQSVRPKAKAMAVGKFTDAQITAMHKEKESPSKPPKTAGK